MGGLAPGPLPGVVPSPNIWRHPDTYELENRAADPDQRIESAMLEILGGADGSAPDHAHGPPPPPRLGWSGLDVLDIGCGTGYHLPRFARTARSVTGVEPHPALARLAARRTASLANVQVRQGSAAQLPVPSGSVDVVHARWAYFFGQDASEPGLREVARVVRRGGVAFVVDNDATRSTFGGWFRRGYPQVDPARVRGFWSRHGWQRRPLDIEWRFDRREDLEAVVRIEFDPATAAWALARHEGLTVDYAVDLWWWRRP